MYSLESERWGFIPSVRARPVGSSKISIYCWDCKDREVQTVHATPLLCSLSRKQYSVEHASRSVLPDSVSDAELKIPGLWSCLQLRVRGRGKAAHGAPTGPGSGLTQKPRTDFWLNQTSGGTLKLLSYAHMVHVITDLGNHLVCNTCLH